MCLTQPSNLWQRCPVRLLLIDNYDSFTFNLAQALAVQGAEVEVVRNQAMTPEEALESAAAGLVISPGPGDPSQTGICAALLQRAALLRPGWPILGVCLGHQLLGQLAGAPVIAAPQPIHGKVWRIRRCPAPLAHLSNPLWDGLPDEIDVMRYHSLVIAPDRLPPAWWVSAESPAREIMAICHRSRPAFGVQFHPESIGSPDGPTLLRNFVRVCQHQQQRSAYTAM